MNYKRHLGRLPFVSIALITIGMTQQAFAAMPQTANAQLDALFARVAKRQIVRQLNNNDSHSLITKNPSVTTSRSASSSSSEPMGGVTHSASSQNENIQREILRLVNSERTKHNLPSYTYNRTLEQSAQEYAAHMRSGTCFSHTACGSTLKERMHASGYYQGGGRSYSYGENIARGQDSAADVMSDWMNSPSHKGAILSSTFKELGVGRSGNYWVQHFGAIR